MRLGLFAFFALLSFSALVQAQAGGAAANSGGSHWIYMEGNEISPSAINGPARNYPAFIMGESTDNSRCIAEGRLFEEGYARDVGTWNDILGIQFEAGSWSGDVEICANTGEGENVVTGGPSRSDNYRGGDHGGEWHDPDTNALTQAFPSGPSDEWENWWIENTPSADSSTWDGAIGSHGMSGFAVEDDCGPQPCDDIGTGTGYQSPFALNPADAFTEGAGDDDHPTRGHAEITGENPSGGLDNLHNRVQAGNLGAGSYTGVGAGNTQDSENAPDLSWDENSHIDPQDDEWALTPSLGYAIDYDGTPYATGRCYGAPREQGVDKTKEQAVYANSFAYAQDVYSGGRSGGLSDGIWINPDDLDLSVLNGGFTCDLTGKDWGYGFADSVGTVNCEQPGDGACKAEGDPSSPGDEGIIDTFPHAIEGEMVFDYEGDPLPYHNQDNLQQYPDACGDDQNEYLIREHAASYGAENNPEFNGRDDYYGCADRPTDCVFQGEVYSQGELIDIQDEEAGENGVDSSDEEICVARDSSIPGGEWVDADNESARDILVGSGTGDNPEYYVRDEIAVDTSDPGKVIWHDGDEDMAARKARLSPYNPIDYETGYALEDDCDPELKYNDDTGCDDSGFDEELIQGEFVYNPFEAGIREDDANVFDGYSMRTLVAWGPGDSFSGAIGATTEQDQENVDGSTAGVTDVTFDSSDDFPTSKLNDSTINLREDNWAISKIHNAVGPTGQVWEAGSCYGMSPLDAGSSQGEYRITKDDKVMGNSLAATTSTSFNAQRGVWINPDSHINTTLEGGLSCDLNGNDWGIGFNNGSGLYVTDNDTDPRYEAEDLHVATGNIPFDVNSDPDVPDNEVEIIDDGDEDSGANSVEWRRDTGEGVNDILFYNGVVYAGGSKVMALDDSDGRFVWNHSFHDISVRGVTQSDGNIYSSSWGDNVVAADATDGNKVWNEGYYPANRLDDITVSNGNVYFTDEHEKLYAADTSDGSYLWNISLDDGNENPLVSSGGTLYVAEDQNLTAIDASDGSQIWTENLEKAEDADIYPDKSITISSIDEKNGKIYVGTYYDGTRVMALDGSDGSEIWTHLYHETGEAEDGVSSITVRNGEVYSGDRHGNIIAADASDGSKIWDSKVHCGLVNGLDSANGYVYSGSEDNTITKFSDDGLSSDINCGNGGSGSGDGYKQRNLQQYPDACGDDQNEYLIREHRDSADTTEQEPNLGRENIYACADRISDCAFHGEVYSEGQLVDVQKYGREEVGSDSVDEEVCVDVDKSVPGGEWMDVDNESLNDLLKGGSYTEDDPGTYNGLVRANSSYSGDGIKWFTDNYDPAAEGELSPYHELDYSDGYALEDDVGPNVSVTSDEGLENEYFTPDAVYSYFEDGHITDDRLNSTVVGGTQREINLGDEFTGVSRRMMVGFANGTVYTEHGKSNNQDTEGVSNADFDSTEFGFPTQKLNDSTINENEDTWAIVNSTETLVGPTGKAYTPGKCYGRHVLDQSDLQVEKEEKVVGNSFAMAVDLPGYKTGSVPEDFKWGTWVNPDSTPLSATEGNLTCELNSTDWGYGYNFAGEADLELTDTRVAGNIAEASFYNWKTGRTHVFSNDTDGTDTIRGVEYSLYRVGGLESDSAEAVIKEGVHNPSDSDLTSFNCGSYSTSSGEKKACNKGDEFTQDDPEGVLDLEVVHGDARSYGYTEDEPHVVMGEITFDINSDPNGFGESENLEQYPDACGDDSNEYLIREHVDTADNTEQRPNLDRNNTYVCADRISDCAFHGEVYSEGQLADIQRYGNEEQGVDSIDQEVCVDVDMSVPGGEWYDVDNESINQLLKGEEGSFTEDDPSTYNGLVRDNASYSGDGVKWFTDDYTHAREVEISPFNPLNYSDGYALEDDVGPGVNYSADEGRDEEQFTPEAVYTFFEDAHREDDRVPDPSDDTRPDPSSDYFEGISVRMYTGFANGTASAEHGATNSQDQENVLPETDFSVTKWGVTVNLNDSTIDPKEDTWAIANRTDAIVGPTGKIYQPGKCYGQYVLDQSDLTLNKSQKAVGNSYAMSVDVNGDGDSRHRGVWVNPDSTPESVRTGGLTCELNSTDWGIGYNLGSEENLEIIRGGGNEFGDVREQGYDRDDPHAVLGEDVVFENKNSWKSNPDKEFDSRLPPQYGNACGDDRYEYLIREHNTTAPNSYQDEHNPTLQRDNIYVCATDVSACALNGTVYQEGQLADVQRNDPSGADEEQGVDSIDEEVCVDVDPSVPGGEWMDVDNESVNEMLKGTHTEDDVESYQSPFVRERSDYSGDGVVWFTDEFEPAAEVENSPYNPLDYSDGYALEDDCADNVQYCSDEGPDEQQFTPEAVYSYFEEGRPEDDANVFDGRSVQMYVGYANGTAYSDYRATNGQDKENTDGVVFDSSEFGWPTPGLNDSTVDPLEDTWAISAELEDPVGPTGKVWEEGKCYGRNPWNVEKNWTTKDEKVVANSYAMGVDVNGYPPANPHYDTSEIADDEKGVWVNPDSTVNSAVTGGYSCDLNATDWGYGYNEGDGTALQVIQGDARSNGFDPSTPHVVAGDIVFDINSDPYGDAGEENLDQYPDACGDDQNEFLIREHGSDPEKSEHGPALTDDDIYACADRQTDCVYNGEVYSMGQIKDISGVTDDTPAEELGSDSIDAEVCVDVDSDLPGGEWVDADNHSIYQNVTGSGTPEQPETYDGFPTTTKRGGDVRWYNTSYNESLDYPVAEAYNSPYNSNVTWKAGYAFEDDVGEEVIWADDSGATETRIKGKAVYTHWEAGKRADDRNVGDGYVLRMYINGSAEHGARNDQEEENVFENLPQLNDSTIDENEDTWAIGSKPYYAVGPTGHVYPNGSCYGRNNPETKAGTVVANSFALAHDIDGDGQEEGDWVNPDYYEEAILKGAGTCSLGEVDDWGLGFNNESRDELRFVQGQSEGRSLGYETSPSWESQLVSGPITFDNRTISGDDPGAMRQDDLPQFTNSCGDDQNEVLVREHSSLTKDLESNKSDEHLPTLERDNIYVCADRESDCAYNGSVYSEGQLADVSGDREIGNSSQDLEVCIDTDERIPGGEWHDIDNSTWNQYLKGEPGDYIEDRPETYEHLVANNTSMRNHWFTDDNVHADEVEISPYNPLNYSDGYALEDDCSEGVEACADIGNDTQRMPGEAIYSAFEEDEGEDDFNVLDGRAVRMYVGYANGTAWTSHGATNNQSEENAGDLNFTVPVPEWHVNAGNSDTPISLNDSTINTREDTWAIANRTDAVVGPTGEVYMDGKCYGGQPNYSEEGWITKNETVMANSLAYSMEANSDTNNEGVWINPDSTNETLLDGEFSCDLNATDWGIGYDMGPSSDLVATMTSESNIRDNGYEASDPHAVAGPIQFDIESDPGEKDQMDEPQFPSACGDDQNEYLIREHGTDTGNEFKPNLSRDNIYGCTDRLSDCVYNGEVYSEGQTVDISGAAAPGEDPERGDPIADEEICLDLDPSIPGGEFYDKDNNWTTESRIKELSSTPEETWDRVEYFQDEDFGANPGTDWKNKTHLLDRENTSYFNNSGAFDQDYDQYSPTGYATEDDCGPILSELGTGPCGDVGPGVQNISWFSAGNFSFVPSNPDQQEGSPQDNYDTALGFKGKHNRIDDDSDQFEPGAATQRNWNLTDVYGADYRIYDTRDSTPGPDKWALTRYLNYSIDNRGNAYRPATADRSGCFYRSNVPVRTDITDDGVMKTDKIFGNSLAVAEDYDGDSQVEGVWKDPDDAAVKYANFTCDITGPDKGYGYDTGDDDGNFIYKNNDKSTHVVEGDIAFSSIEGKKGAFEQEPPVCGDDHKEFLLEELGEVSNSQSNTGRWGCGTDRDDCVSRSGGEFALYREGDVVNTEEAAESFGRSKFDEEVCMQRSQDTYGVWYDQDYSKDLCQVNNLYGSAGIRWLDADYIDTHPYSVVEGINDDLNPYLYNRRSDFNESTQGNVSDYLSNTNDRSPVPTGKWVNRSVDQYYSDFGSFTPSDTYLNLTATKGFCGGDDEGENVVVQQASTDLIETNFSVIGIADNPDDCVLDGDNIDAVSHDDRKLYSPGDEVELDFGQSTRRISCFAGQWFANWPVTFVDRNISIEEETTANIQFKVVNVRNTRTTYEVELDPDSEIEPFTSFTEFEGDTFTTTVPAESTESYSLEVYGEDSSIGPVNITLDAQSLTGDIEGSDNVTVDVVEGNDAGGTSQSVDEVPGIGFLQLIMMMILSTLIYYRRLD